MRKMYVWLLVNLGCLLSVKAQYFEWAQSGGLWAYDYGYGVTTDNYGRIYVAGKYEQNAIFTGASGTTKTVGCEGNHDIYLAQYSPSGQLNWVRTAGGWTGDYATCVTTDGTNFVYIGGEIEGKGAKIEFQGSPITLTCEGSNDIVLAKYTLNGDLIWARRAGGPYYEKALGITLDKDGNVYACGLFNKYAKFGGTTSVYGRGENDIWIAKYSKDGNLLWVKTAGSSGRDEAKAIKCDAYGNVYITGLYKDGCKIGDKYLSAAGGFNCFVAKYSPSGNLIWVKTGGGKYDDVGWGLTIENNILYIAGEFNASAVFSGQTINTTGSQDVLVASYDLNGNLLWLRKAGGKLSDRARGMGSANGKLYITGQFGSTANFGGKYKTAVDSADIFMACMSTSGNFEWVMTAGGPSDAYEELGYESGIAITARSGAVYATGAMLGSTTFGGTTTKKWSRTDMYITKINIGAADELVDCPDDEGTLFFKGLPETTHVGAEPIQLAASIEGGEFSGPGMKENVFYPSDAGPGKHVITYTLKGKGDCVAQATDTVLVIMKPAITTSFTIEEIAEVYPNPTNGPVIIDIKTPIEEESEPGKEPIGIKGGMEPGGVKTGDEGMVQLILYNSAGQVIESKQLNAPKQVSLDLSDKDKGVYLLMLRSGEMVIQKKIILQ